MFKDPSSRISRTDLDILLYSLVMQRKPLVSDEIYHVYNRGAHKERIFDEDWDYQRFSLLLYLANHSEPLHLSNILKQYQGPSLLQIFKDELSDKSLVDIFAYCLMPNHFHLLIRQKTENGISRFMKKLMTGYSMYFNVKYDHSGVLFQGRFKSRHIDSDEYLRYIFSYIHLNPVDLVEPGWKEAGLKNKSSFESFLTHYAYSSFVDYLRPSRPERAILATDKVYELVNNPNNLDELLTFYKNGQQYQGRSLINGDKGGSPESIQR